MKRFVVVEASPFPDVLRARCADASSGGRLSVRLRPADRVHAASPDILEHSVVDEHFVVDVDACRDGRLLDCADVLQGSRAAHSVADAMRRLTDLTSAHPACGVAAIPLTGVGGAGGWAVAAGGASDRAVALVPYGPYPAYGEPSLLPSCVHAWLVAGRSLREWPYARNAPSS
ncbi:hypothetical protein ACFUN8_14095 [Streptomyces sp. NPDC057307]|uniref:hypothetical protein n=1 Tax=Streptomyces sp. NPDC057307 TaxID=3346096 RepID=UPI0036333D9E